MKRLAFATQIQERIDRTLAARGAPRARLDNFRDLLALEGETLVRQALKLFPDQPADPSRVSRLVDLLAQGTAKEFLLWHIATEEGRERASPGPAWSAILTDDIFDHLGVDDLLYRSGPLFEELCYRRVLGRAPESTGDSYGQGVLARGCRKPFVLWLLLRSQEARNRRTRLSGDVRLAEWVWSHANSTEILAAEGPDFLELCYRRVLGRAPDAQGVAGWVELLARGCRKEFLFWLFLRSPEAFGRFRPPEGAEGLQAWVCGHAGVHELLVAEGFDFLELCFRRLLGRAPDLAGAARFCTRLQRGHSKERVLSLLLRSPEAQARGTRLDGENLLDACGRQPTLLRMARAATRWGKDRLRRLAARLMETFRRCMRWRHGDLRKFRGPRPQPEPLVPFAGGQNGTPGRFEDPSRAA